MKILAFNSPFIYAPIYLLSIYAFAKGNIMNIQHVTSFISSLGRDWIKEPLLMWSGAMICTIVLILVEGLYGEFKTSHPYVFLASMYMNIDNILTIFSLWRVYASPSIHLIPIARTLSLQKTDQEHQNSINRCLIILAQPLINCKLLICQMSTG